jgi:hypothetical protein
VKLAVKHASCLTPCRQDFSSHPSQIVWNYLNTDLSNECGTRFDMPAPTVTPEIKKELQLLQLRGVMDPKRHYKASDMKGIPKYFQVRFSDLIMATISKQDFFFHKLCGASVHGNHHSCLVFATPADWNSSGRRC